MLCKKILLILTAVLLTTNACRTKVDDDEALIETIEISVGKPSTSNSKGREELLSKIKAATSEIGFVANSFTDTEIAQAIIDKKEQEQVIVLAAADSSSASDGGIVALQAAGITVTKNEGGGQVESNFFVVDRKYCWLGSGGIGSSTFTGAYSFILNIQSVAICREFQTELELLAKGAMFADSGTANFGKFRHNKPLADPNNRFDVGDLHFRIFFAPQESPLNPLITFMMNTTDSIRFMARAVTHDRINDETDRSKNRSHMQNVLQYKSRIASVLGGSFTVKGVIDDELIAATDTCSPFSISHQASVHCELSDSLGASVIRKYTGTPGISFDLFLFDIETERPQLVFLTSDLRRVGGFDITDAVMVIIEPGGPFSGITNESKDLFNNAKKMIDELFLGAASI